MPRYTVTGAWRGSGTPGRLTLPAATSEEAEAVANVRGLLVDRVAPVRPWLRRKERFGLLVIAIAAAAQSAWYFWPRAAVGPLPVIAEVSMAPEPPKLRRPGRYCGSVFELNRIDAPVEVIVGPDYSITISGDKLEPGRWVHVPGFGSFCVIAIDPELMQTDRFCAMCDEPTYAAARRCLKLAFCASDRDVLDIIIKPLTPLPNMPFYDACRSIPAGFADNSPARHVSAYLKPSDCPPR